MACPEILVFTFIFCWFLFCPLIHVQLIPVLEIRRSCNMSSWVLPLSYVCLFGSVVYCMTHFLVGLKIRYMSLFIKFHASESTCHFLCLNVKVWYCFITSDYPFALSFQRKCKSFSLFEIILPRCFLEGPSLGFGEGLCVGSKYSTADLQACSFFRAFNWHLLWEKK